MVRARIPFDRFTLTDTKRVVVAMVITIIWLSPTTNTLVCVCYYIAVTILLDIKYIFYYIKYQFDNIRR